jgi:hypothetical protein
MISGFDIYVASHRRWGGGQFGAEGDLSAFTQNVMSPRLEPSSNPFAGCLPHTVVERAQRFVRIIFFHHSACKLDLKVGKGHEFGNHDGYFIK